MGKAFRVMSGAFLVAMSPMVVAAEAPMPMPPAQSDTLTQDARLTAFLDDAFEQELAMHPQLATQLGSKTGQNRLDDISDAGQFRLLQWRRANVARMKALFDRAALSPEGRVNYDIWALELDRAEVRYRFRRYQPPFYSTTSSLHASLPQFMIARHIVQSPEDMHDYSARLKAMAAVLDSGIELSRLAAKQGIHTPRFQIEQIIAGSRQLITGAPFDTGPDAPLWVDAKAKIARLQATGKATPEQASALLAEAREAVLATGPAYQRVIVWAQGELPTAPSGQLGAVTLPHGAVWYAAALKLNTTTDLTADQIHTIGLAEVTRIEAAQDVLARKAGVADRHAYYAQRAALFPPVPWTDALRADYLAKANAFLAHTRSLLPAQFGALPAYRAQVSREPAFSEVAGGPAHAAYPSPDGTRPGQIYVHLLGVTPDPAWMYTLMCHEGIPGHVMQGDIQVRQSGVPRFRKGYNYVASAEGWGLYAEAVCGDMGAYPDVAAQFLQLDSELFRAARLVADTGIHARGWSEDQAVDYLITTGRQPPATARSEVRRYITLPGQATGYKIGMLRIMALREKARAALGAHFDVRAYNDLVLAGGSLPLSTLEQRVDDWIAAQKL